jgi:DNA-binding beta-propeller fold protein YncE
MRRLVAILGIAGALSAGMLARPARGETPYKVVRAEKVGGEGGFDYVYADSDGRKLYIPRGNRVTVFDLDSLKSLGEIPQTNGVHGAAVDPVSHHGFSSSRPVVMWDTETLKTIKTIDVQGGPDGIFFDPATEHVMVLSHRSPNVTVIDGKDGSVVGTIDLGGAPEQGVSDGNGKLYIDLEDKNQIAVVDAKENKVVAHYDLGGKGEGPVGLALDTKNGILFACCHNSTAVILSAADGKIITTVPIGNGVDGAAFNQSTLEAFSSQRDGTLTVISEKSPTEFVAENVPTKVGAKTCTLDTKTNQVYLITAERAPAATQPTASAAPAQGAQGGQGGRRGGRGGPMVPGSFTILVVGK